MSMALGTCTLTHYPSAFTQPRPQRSNAHLITYASVAHFSWGVSIIGKIIEVLWHYMPSEQFEELDAVFQGDAEVVWDPGILPSGSDDPVTYNVQILDFTGDYHETVGTDPEIWRANCKMTLLIMSEVP
jgi:hypothetical protein